MSQSSRQTDCRKFDVVVAGAGLIGAASACLFARQGLSVALVEAQPITEKLSTWQATPTLERESHLANQRVSAINIATCNLLQTLQIWPQLPTNMLSPYRAMEVWDYHSPARISFCATEIRQPYLGYIVDNQTLQMAMLEKLEQNYNVTLIDNAEVIGLQRGAAKLGVTLSNFELETRLLVGADGCHSRIRELCNLQTHFSDFAQDAIVTTLSTSRKHAATARQCFMETGPVAMLPLSDGRCSLVWSCDRDQVEALMQLDETEFCARLQPLFGHELGEISGCQQRQRFALTQHHASRYITDKVALIGDAAHVIHPLAGLGANLGFADAAALAQVVTQAQARGNNIGQYSVLRRYERWRKGDNALVLTMLAQIKDIFGSRLNAAKTVRGFSVNLLDAISPLKIALAKFACGLYGDLPAVCRRG